LPKTSRIDKNHGCIYTDFSGRVRYDEFVQAMDRLFRNPEYDPSYCELFDFSACDHFEINYEKMQSVVERNSVKGF